MMGNRERFLHFLDCYARKDLQSIADLLEPDAALRDWNVSVRGAEAVLAETCRNFEADRIEITVLRLHEAGDTVAGELRIVVDAEIELHVIDVIDFSTRGKVAAIRAYKGRGD